MARSIASMAENVYWESSHQTLYLTQKLPLSGRILALHFEHEQASNLIQLLGINSRAHKHVHHAQFRQPSGNQPKASRI